jgi:predicted transcriptional regulator
MTTATLTREIDNLIKTQIQSGHYTNKVEVERDIDFIMAERELDRNLAKGMADYENGRYEEMNDKWIKNYITKLSKRISTNQ